MHQGARLCHLARQPLAPCNVRGSVAIGDCIAAKALQLQGFVGRVGRAHLRIHETGQIIQRLLAQIAQPQVALQARAQAHQAALDPALLHFQAVVTGVHDR